MSLARRASLLTAAVLVTLGSVAPAATNYFVVAERPGTARHHDSYVLPLTNATAIAHARALIANGPGIGQAIVVARIAAGADGVNRDYLAQGAPAWSWHVTSFVAFADSTIEILDGWPGYVENNVAGWIANTGGSIGFWTYTVVDEIPGRPQITAVSVVSNRLQMTVDQLTVPCAAEVLRSGDLLSNAWETVNVFSAAAPSTNCVLPVTNTLPQGFYRVTVR